MRAIMTVLLAYTLLACSVVTQPDELVSDSASPSPLALTVAPSPSPTATPVPIVEETVPSATPPVPANTTDEPADSEPSPRTGSGPTGGFQGEISLEEMVAYHPTIVKARLDSITSGTGQFLDSDWPSSYGRYFIVLKFNLTVVEYLKGTGPANIVAVWISHSIFGTNAEAEAAVPTELAARDDRWDDREALFFLNDDGFGPPYPSSLKAAGYYFLSAGLGHGHEDRYTINSDWRKAWLPAAAQASSANDSQEFLLAPPHSGTPTITLGNMKKRIAEMTAELNGGDGSEAYKDCIKYKYTAERENRYRESQGKSKNYAIPTDHKLGSGQPFGTIVHSHAFGYGTSADRKARAWLDGKDSVLFSVVESQHVQTDDVFTYDFSVVGARPIPAGLYKLNYQLVPFGYVDCGHAFTTALTVNVVVPDGTLHELFFDPVTDGSAVSADATNGVLKPAAFTASNGASATVESISYESGTVRVKVVPWSSLSGHVLDFIELDGRVSLSLSVTNSTVHTADDVFVWPVGSRPWEDGDKLMVRIRPGFAAIASPPARATATASGGESINLSWDAGRGAAGYQVQRRESGVETWEMEDDSVTERSYVVSGLSLRDKL